MYSDRDKKPLAEDLSRRVTYTDLILEGYFGPVLRIDWTGQCGRSEASKEAIAIIWQEILVTFPGRLDMGHERRNGVRDDFMVWGLSKKNGELSSDIGRLLREGNEKFSVGMLSMRCLLYMQLVSE